LVPVGATLLLIFAAASPDANSKTPLPNRLLASRPLVTLGTFAYSLYLWHWPLLIFWLAHSDRSRAGLVDGAFLLVVSAALAYLTTRFIEHPLRYRPGTTVSIAWRTGWYRQPTTVAAFAVIALAALVTVSSLTWRQYVVVVQAHGADLPTLASRDYPGAQALLEGVKVPQLPMRPSVLEASNDLPKTTTDGCISDFGNAEVINCIYGDTSASRTIALAGGSHSEHWVTALDLLGRQHQFKIVTYLKMGCPLSTEQSPIITGSMDPYPQCRQWFEQVMPKLIADRPDYVFTTTTRPRVEPGDEVPASYIGVWDMLAQNGISILGMRDTPWLLQNGQPSAPADCLARGGDAVTCGIPRSDVLADRNPTLDIAAALPNMIPLDMSDAVCRRDICPAVEGNILIYHDSHHLGATYVRSMAPELGRQISTATGWW